MFNQLIESSSHRKELKRRGSFLVFTTLIYVALFAITGVVSIYAYDAHLEDQVIELGLVMRPSDLPQPVEKPLVDHGVVDHGRPTTPSSGGNTPPTIHSIDHPEAVPEGISTARVTEGAAPFLPGKGGHNVTLDPGGVGRVGSGSQTKFAKPTMEVLPDELPPKPAPSSVKIFQATKVINGLAVYLPKPTYPAIAKQIHVQGSVNVQVLIDETGKVVSAKAVSGHPLLIHESVRAATNARFTPTMLNGQPVKLSGVIVYNFVMQ